MSLSKMEMIDISGMPVEQIEAIAKAAFGGNLGWHIGPFLLAVLFDGILLGVVSQQYLTWWIYSRQTERRLHAFLTHFLLIASVVYTGCEISYCLHNFVYNFGQYRVFLEVNYPQVFPLLGWIMSAPVQLFYTERSYRLNGESRILVGLLVSLIVTTLGVTVWILVACQSLSSELQAFAILPPVQAWQSLTLATDSIITASIGWGLYRSRTGWSHTDDLVKRVTLITLETQLGPTLLMLAFVIEFAINPPSTIGIFFEQLIPKFYVVGYLATINSRFDLRRASCPATIGPCTPSKPNTYYQGSSPLHQDTVIVDTDTYVESYKLQCTPPGINRIQQLEGLKETCDDHWVEHLDFHQSNKSNKTLHDPAQLV
ncbi:uncharacterized protein IL334_004828 [Kwoniella shivajii]|uniref:DUF6534 domain-containing protein n=1 Tax=Kwoniella shivajii TaxID=564305 RepID=A0ABZ1D1F5_9TREE|nr:hypothetical protein IL334_004828 [Kwoniella shivajii]